MSSSNLPPLRTTKNWFTGTTVLENNWDNINNPLNNWATSVGLAFDQVCLDAFGVNYKLNNTGAPALVRSLQDQINDLVLGIVGVTSLTIINSSPTSPSDPFTIHWRKPSAAADNDTIASIQTLNSDTTQDAISAQIQVIATDVTHATRSSAIAFQTMASGVLAEHLRVTSDGIEINGNVTGTYNFGGTPTFTNGITIPTTKPLNLNIGGTSLIKEGAADRIDIVTAGVSSFFAARGLLISADGSAGTPALGIGEGDTGLYKIGDNNLGFSANGIKIFDYSDTLASFQRPILINATTATTAHAFEVDASFLTSAYGAYVYSNSSSSTVRDLVRIHNDNTSASGTYALHVVQDASRAGITVEQNGDARGLDITATGVATANALNIDASNLTTGKAASFYSNSADTSTRNLVNIYNDNSAATGTTPLYVRQDAQANIAAFDYNGSVVAAIDYKGQLLLSSNDPPDANRLTQASGMKVYGTVSAGGSLFNSYNVSSSSKIGPGVYSVIINTDFASASSPAVATVQTNALKTILIANGAVGTYTVSVQDAPSSTQSDQAFGFIGAGAQ